jgi:hypothetical protein
LLDCESLVCPTVPEDEIDGGVSYSFQVISRSTNNYEAFSNVYDVPTPRNMISIFIATSAVCFMIILCIVAVTLYLKRNLFSSYGRGDKI